MKEKQEIFVDGIAEVHLINSMVRIDFMTIQHSEQDAENNMNVNLRLIMTPQSLLASMGAMQQIAEKLAEAGVFKKAQQ